MTFGWGESQDVGGDKDPVEQLSFSLSASPLLRIQMTSFVVQKHHRLSVGQEYELPVFFAPWRTGAHRASLLLLAPGYAGKVVLAGRGMLADYTVDPESDLLFDPGVPNLRVVRVWNPTQGTLYLQASLKQDHSE